MLHVLRTVEATPMPLHQPEASEEVSQLSKLHCHNHNGCKDIRYYLPWLSNFSHLKISELNSLGLNLNKLTKCMKNFV